MNTSSSYKSILAEKERLLAENQRLRQVEQQYLCLLQTSSEGVIIYDAEGNVMMVNQAAEHILGLTKSQIEGRTLKSPSWRTIKEDGEPFSTEKYPAHITMKTGAPQRDVIMGVEKAPSLTIWIKVNSSPLYQEALPPPYAVIVTFYEVTLEVDAHRELFHTNAEFSLQTEEIKAQYEELELQNQILEEQRKFAENQREILKNVINNIPVYIAMLDSYGCYVVVNDKYEVMFGKSLAEIQGKHFSEVLSQELLAAARPYIERGLRGQTCRFEQEMHHPHGYTFYGQGRYIPIFDKEGQVQYLNTYVYDISTLKNTEKNLIDLNHTKDKLFTIIAHDLRSPLGTLAALLMLMEEGRLSEAEFKETLKDLEENLDYTSQLLNNLLSWASTQMKKQVLRIACFSLNELVESNIRLLRKSALNKNLSIKASLQEEIKVWADQSMVDLVLRNLISNAIKFTPEGGQIALSLEQKGMMAWVHIQDNGVGMSEETQQHIFNRKMFSTKGTRHEKGTGLGLILCKEFVEKNRGSLSLVSKLGSGSTFSFSLPLRNVGNG